MKVYVASSFSLIPRVEAAVRILEGNGHTVAVRWWERLHLKQKLAPEPADVFYRHPECAYAYNRDKAGIQEADALVFVAAGTQRLYTGANVELGMALAWGKPCYVWGVLKNSALYYPVIRCRTMNQVLKNLNLQVAEGP